MECPTVDDVTVWTALAGQLRARVARRRGDVAEQLRHPHVGQRPGDAGAVGAVGAADRRRLRDADAAAASAPTPTGGHRSQADRSSGC